MNELIGRVFGFEKVIFPDSGELFARLTSQGQEPKALMVSCADSRVVPEHILQAKPGDLFVCRNAGNIVPPFATMNGGVSSTVEYAVAALGVRDIIICGHSDCGAMKALADPTLTEGMPNVAAWLRHGAAAAHVVDRCCPDLSGAERVHHWLVILLLVLIPGHAGAALKHHFWDRHDVLRGMLPEVPDAQEPQGGHRHKPREPRFPPDPAVG